MGGRNKGEPYQPTQRDRGLVAMLISCGIPHDIIVRFVVNSATNKPISLSMFARKFGPEIKTEGTAAKAMLEGRAFQMAMDGDTTMMIFLLKTKCGFKPPPDEVLFTQSYAALVEAATKPKDVPVPTAALKLVGSGKA
jgi:hypothetical protein